MNVIFNYTPAQIEVKVHEAQYEYNHVILTTVSSYDEVKEIDAFVRKYMPGYHISTRQITDQTEQKDDFLKTCQRLAKKLEEETDDSTRV
jgi:predicted DNA-binding ArsR family transcriptional regulator